MPVTILNCPGPMVTVGDLQSAKSFALTLIWYGVAGFTSLNSKKPLSGVTSVRRSLLSRVSRTTVALGIGSQFASVTVPTSFPGLDCLPCKLCPCMVTESTRAIAGTTAERMGEKIDMRLSLFPVKQGICQSQFELSG